MKILSNLLNPMGLGADRWVYEGYQRAFIEAGHEFFFITENDDFKAFAERINPDMFLLDFLPFMDYRRRVQDVSVDFLRSMKARGTKIVSMTSVGLDKEEDEKDKIALFRTYLPVIDICFSNFTPETTAGFKEMYGKEIYFVPHAADTTRFFPEKPDPRFDCDIAFVGSFYAQKGPQFKDWLMPLFKQYKVRVYGSGWTLKGKMLRALSGVGRRARFEWLANFANARRVTISTDDERKLYASAKICVDIHEYYRNGATKGFSNEREFKTTVSGGFLITDYVPGMERYFNLGKEIVAVKSSEEWFAKIAYYLDPAHEAERKQIQTAGTERVLNEHTYQHRVRQLLDLYHSLTA